MTLLHRNFEALADNSGGANREKTTHLVAIMQEQADIMHSVPAAQTYENIVGERKGRYETTRWRQPAGHKSKPGPN
jgi:hypothetical protein